MGGYDLEAETVEWQQHDPLGSLPSTEGHHGYNSNPKEISVIAVEGESCV